MTIKHLLRSSNLNCFCHFPAYSENVFRPTMFYPLSFSVRYKGHSKWQNIKSDKAKGDALKNLMINKFRRRIYAAVKDGPPDPKLNRELNTVFIEAMKNNISFDSLTRITADVAKKPMVSCTIDVKGPGESCFVIEATGKTRKWCLQAIDYRTKTVPGGFKVDDPSVKPYFSHLGVLWVLKNSALPELSEESKRALKASSMSQESSGPPPPPLTLDDAETLAIEVNAESATEIVDDNDDPAFEIICDPAHVQRVERELLNKRYILTKAESEFRPLARVKLTPQHKQYVDQYYEALQLVEEVENIFDNLEQTEE